MEPRIKVNSLNNFIVPAMMGGGYRPSTATLTDFIMANMTAGQVEASTGGILLLGDRDTVISGVSIDSRTLHHGDLFFAIRGAVHDGHKYIPSAISKGALGAVVDAAYEVPERYPADRILLRVNDTHQAFKDLAAEVRRQWTGNLVAISGSMGKTTTKDFAAILLQAKYNVYRSPGNYNNLFGLPLAIFKLSPDDHIGIFEMGMSAPGEIAEMCRIAEPSIGIITNIAPVHLESMGTMAEIAKAKGEMVEALPARGTLIFNADNEWTCGLAAHFRGEKIAFGFSEHAQVRADEIAVSGTRETRFRLRCPGISRRAVIPVAGAHFVMNTLPAIALALHFNLTIDQIVERLRDLRQAPMRGQIIPFQEGFTIIDDSYNSNPEALKNMIQLLANLPSFKRRVLVAGEMLELGHESSRLHRECGAWAAACGIDIVVGVQGSAKEIAAGAVAAGAARSRVHFFTEINPAIDFISRNVQPGDLILIKGSRGIHLEKMVQAMGSHYQEP
jgi:UDP-N-acetylmuramoyl-tripeptide--D-alanyl-D-alanine ligase